MAIKLGPNSRLRDVTSEESGKTLGLVGAESFRQRNLRAAQRPQQLLRSPEFDRLAPYQQEIVELAMRNDPALSLAECIEMLQAFGL
jgi:hypothetical protein